MKTLLQKSVCFNTDRNISIENANFDLLKGKSISFKYKYLESDMEENGFISLKLPSLENSLIKDFIISEINIKLSDFVQEKNDIFVPNVQITEVEQEFNGNPDLDIRNYFTKL